jgi:hypothetical protein
VNPAVDAGSHTPPIGQSVDPDFLALDGVEVEAGTFGLADFDASVDALAPAAVAASPSVRVDSDDSGDFESPEPTVTEASSSVFFEPLDGRRSIFAQPEPLKCTLGARKAFRTGAPQIGHFSGPGA